MISGLQGEFGDLDIKYLKQNISRCQSEISGSFRRNFVALYTERKTLRVSAIRGSGHVCLGKLKLPPLPFGCEISGCEMSTNGIPLPGWNELCRKGDRLRVKGVGTPPPDDTERALLSGATPSGFPKRTRATMLSGSTPSGFPHEDMRRHAIRTPSGRSTRHS